MTLRIPVQRSSSFNANSANLDFIRAAAVLFVLIGHLSSFLQGASLTAWHFAQIGVSIFFVHTSMVLMLSLDRMRLKGKALLRAFYLRRFFRLYPLSIFCVTCAMVAGRAPLMAGASTIRHWKVIEYVCNLALIQNLTYTDNMVGGLWTLPLEVQMYIVLPFLFVLSRRSGLLAPVLMWLASIPLAVFQPHVTGRAEVLGYAPCFIAGVIAWKLSESVSRRWPGWLWPAAFAATWPIFFLAEHNADMPYRWIFCLALGAEIPLFGEIEVKPLKVVGGVVAKYSYGIYLSHVAIILWCFGLPVSRTMQWAIFIPLVISCPFALYHLIEHPAIEYGRKVIESMNPARNFAAATIPDV